MVDNGVAGHPRPQLNNIRVISVGEDPRRRNLQRQERLRPESGAALGSPSQFPIPVESMYKDDAREQTSKRCEYKSEMEVWTSFLLTRQ